jgi:parvulin-like peptidyl-prolyl isomerase
MFFVVAALSTTTLTSCSEILRTSALSIGERTVSVEYVNKVVEQLAGAQQVELVDGKVAGDAVRSVLAGILRVESAHVLLEQYGLTVTDEDRRAVLEQFAEDPVFDLLGEELTDLLVSLNAQDLALARLETPSRETLAAMYAKSPASVGSLCVRHLVVTTEAEAWAAQRRVLSGEKFAAVAGDVSIEPNAEQTGGALADENSTCLSLGVYQGQFDRLFTAGALRARAGVPTAPVKSSFGWHVIFVRPFEEVADSIAKSLNEQPGEALLAGYVATAPVRVASRYGRWDPSVGQFVAIGS